MKREKVDIVFKMTEDGKTTFSRDMGYLLGDDLIAQRGSGLAVHRMAYDARGLMYLDFD